MTDTINPRLAYLHKAIQHLAVASPTIAATLGTQRDMLLQSQDTDLSISQKEWRMYRQATCGACGNCFMPGWSSTSSLSGNSTNGISNKTRVKPETKITKEIAHSCLRCGRNTIIPLEHRPPRHMRKKVTRRIDSSSTNLQRISPSTIPSIAIKETMGAAPPKTASASSKQRAKARKGGLQAMLAQSKAQSSAKPGLGLDLMDFMQ